MEANSPERGKRRLFVFDNDSTLFDHSIGTVREKSYEALEKLKEKGHLLCLNTSRSLEETYNIPKRLFSLMDAVILLDGAYMIIGGQSEVVYLDEDVVKRVLAFFEKNDITYRYCLDDGTGYLNRKDPEKENLFRTLYDMVPAVKPYEGERIIHILYYATGELREEVIRLCGQMETCRMSIAGEISPRGRSKGKSMLLIGERYGIGREDIVAFGDSGNDIDMMERAGLGICMGNGEEACKKAADFVTDDIREEGLYNALVRFGFIEEEV